MTEVSFAGIWDATLAAVREEAPLVVPVAAAFLFLPQLLFARWMGDLPANEWFTPGNSGRTLLVFIPVALASLVGQIAITAMALRAFPGRTVAEALGQSAARIMPAIAANLIQAIAFVGGLLLLILPGFYLLARLILVIPILVCETRDPLEAVRRSWELTRGRGLKVTGFLLVLIFGFLLISLAMSGIAAAVGVLASLGGAAPEAGWGVARWLVELLNAAASAGITLIFILFTAMLYSVLVRAPAADD
jgi:hypothetical protein